VDVEPEHDGLAVVGTVPFGSLKIEP
jgi:hypothetical protein